MSPLALPSFRPAEFLQPCPPGTGKRGQADCAGWRWALRNVHTILEPHLEKLEPFVKAFGYE